MANWKEPKTDWKGGDTPTDNDANRWEENAKYLYDNKITADENGRVPLKNMPTSNTANRVLRVGGAKSAPVYGQVIRDDIADGAVSNTKIADKAVTGEKISSSAITSTQLADRAVTNSKIAGSAVSTDKIANGAVSKSKLASSVSSQLSSYSSGKLYEKPTTFYLADSRDNITKISSKLNICYQRYGRIVMVDVSVYVSSAMCNGAIEYIDGSILPYANSIADDVTLELYGSGYEDPAKVGGVVTPLNVMFNTHNKLIEVHTATTGERYQMKMGHGYSFSFSYMITDQNASV